MRLKVFLSYTIIMEITFELHYNYANYVNYAN